jgi:pre-mRNA-splicing factor SYF1
MLSSPFHHESRFSYLKLEANDKEEFIKYLRKAGKLDQAAQVLAEIVNDEDYVSTHGTHPL